MDLSLADSITEQLQSKFKKYYENISSVFDGLGNSNADAWKTATASRENMYSFGEHHGFVAKPRAAQPYDNDVVKEWNSAHQQRRYYVDIQSIHHICILDSTTARAIHAITATIMRALSNSGNADRINISVQHASTTAKNSAPDREECILFLKDHLPLECFPQKFGCNFNDDFMDNCILRWKENGVNTLINVVASSSSCNSTNSTSTTTSSGTTTSLRSPITTGSPSLLSDSLDNESGLLPSKIEIQKLILELFPNGLVNASSVRHMNKDTLMTLATFLQRYDSPNFVLPSTLNLLRAYCLKNISRLEILKDQIEVAMKLAVDCISRRVKEYTRYMKTLIRAGNELYSQLSDDFRVYFIANGLLNFSEHYCNNHKSCNRFCWWCICCAGSTVFTPNNDYVTDIDSQKDATTNRLLPVFFKLLICSWVMCKESEQLMFKVVSGETTCICESYFHWLAINIPKWMNCGGEQYRLLEAVAFIAFITRSEEMVQLSKKLVGNKYAPTLVAVQHQKKSKHRTFVLDALQKLFPDSATQQAVVRARNTILQLFHARKKRQLIEMAKVDESALLRNLKMGPSSETATFDVTARPVPSFPFPNVALHTSPEQNQELEDVWLFTQETKNKTVELKSKRAMRIQDSAADTTVAYDSEASDSVENDSVVG